MKIPAQKVTWFGVFRKSDLFTGRILQCVKSSEAECREYIDDNTKGTFALYAGQADRFMIEPVVVNVKAYVVN